jgi:formylmethanofuran dehydrogenase subunit A
VTAIRITGGRVYDPANEIDGDVRDGWLEDGRVVESGPPDAVLLSPVNERTRSFVSAVL